MFLFAVSVSILGFARGEAPAWPTFWSANWTFVDTTTNGVMERGLWYYNVTQLPGLARQDNNIDCPITAFNRTCDAIFRYDQHIY